MSFLRNMYIALTDKRELTEPKIYSTTNPNSLLQQLYQLRENPSPHLDIKKIEDHIKLFEIGLSGEQNVLFELQHTLMPMLILQDIYIQYEDYKAQLDFIVITRQFILVIEVKKLFGDIQVTDKGDFQRVISKNNRIVKREGMYSPLNQVERHVTILSKLLREENMIKHCPVTYAVTFANPKTIIDISKKAPKSIHSHVIRHDQIKPFLKTEFAKSSHVSFPDLRMTEIADKILSYQKERVLKVEDYHIAGSEPVIDSSETKREIDNDELKQALIDFRLQRSRELQIKAYYIFNNQTLEQLVSQKPQSIVELLDVDGFGPKKVEEYGDDIVGIITRVTN